MRLLAGLTFLLIVLSVPTRAFSRPVDESVLSSRIRLLDFSGENQSDLLHQASGHGLTASAAGITAGTTYYGGTVWDSLDGRWEAIMDSCWTFDSGVNTEVITTIGGDYPGVDPFKPAGLHAYMEGWIGFDRSYSEIPYFRILDDGSGGTSWDNICVGSNHAGAPGVLGGSYSFYCGVLGGEAEDLCYLDSVNKEGYGNSWSVCIGKTYYNFTGGPATLSYDFVNESESGFDFTTVEIDTSGDGSAGTVVVATYDGFLFGNESLALTPGFELPSGARDSIQVRFCFSSDGSWSDEDGLNPTLCGAFSVDDISFVGGGHNDGPSGFEGGDANGWARLPATRGPGGEWTNLVDFSTIPAEETGPCSCNLQGNVLVFEDLTTPLVSHNRFQDNYAGSPWIELAPGNAGPGKFIQFDVGANLDVVNYVLTRVLVKWYPTTCPATGQDIESPWISDGFLYTFGGVPVCTPSGFPVRVPLSGIVPPAATDVRIAVGVISLCRFFGNCSGLSNVTPVFDNIKLGVFGNPFAPLIATSAPTQAQDAFPANGTLRADAPGRFDSTVKTGARTLGDTLVVDGGSGGAEVHMELRVTPGPGMNGSRLTSFYAGLTARGGGWYSARMDTAEFGQGGAIDGKWMTTYHELDPHFGGGSDTDVDGSDTFGAGHLAHDFIPDDLFTPGTRIDYFFRTKSTGEPDVPASYFFLPDTSGGQYFEWECLPSSMNASDEFNCLLYVDRFDGRGAQPYIEAGLLANLGAGSSNAEGVNWDRFDYGATLGRPLGSVYGATVSQLLGYRTIVWNSGSFASQNLGKEDADQLIPWLTLLDFQGNNLYLSGDGLAHSVKAESASNPSGLVLLNDILGVDSECNTFRDINCPAPSPADVSPCVLLDPVTGVVAPTSGRAFFHDAQGNGCPQQRSFDVLALGSPTHGASASGDEQYVGAVKTVQWASIAADASAAGQPQYRAVVDGVSVHHRRDTTSEGCTSQADPSPVTERISEVLAYFGSAPAQSCSDRTTAVGTPHDRVEPGYRTSLIGLAPNPLPPNTIGEITFTLAKEGRARMDIFDIHGRLVNTVFDELATEGTNHAYWNGEDETGRAVASGVYFYRLDTADKILSSKLVLVRSARD